MLNDSVRAIKVLRIVRNCSEIDGYDLREKIRQELAIKRVGFYWEFEPVMRLMEAGLLLAHHEAEVISADQLKSLLTESVLRNLRFSTSPHFWPLMHLLGVETLADMENRLSESAVSMNPLYKPIDDTLVKRDIFVVMPFAPALRPVFDEAIRPAGQIVGLSVARADDFFTQRAIMEDVWQAIYDAKIIVADCTGRNANVFYELGIAHTIGRYTITLAQSAEDIPFDIQGLRYLLYKNTDEGRSRLCRELQSAFQQIGEP